MEDADDSDWTRRWRTRAALGVVLPAFLLLSTASCSDSPSSDAGASADAGIGDAGGDSGLDGGGLDGTPDAAEPIPVSPNTSGWWRNATVYEIFVRSFADSNGDGIGDLRGVTDHLDYLAARTTTTSTTVRSLGVDAIWLMPINPSPSYHGYDVTNYRAVNPQYGTLDDFDALVHAAHARGLRVVLDFVMNHTSSQHPWFDAAKAGPTADKRDWYLWRTDDPGWRRPWDQGRTWRSLGGGYWFYGIFSASMPDLNLTNPAVEAEMVDTMRFWLARGVDGFRMDAARYFIESPDGDLADRPETHALVKRVRQVIHQDHPETLFVAEAWTSMDEVAGYYGHANEFQLAFSFDLAEAIKNGLNDGGSANLVQNLRLAETTYADRGFEAPFLSNHDEVRVMQVLRGDAAKARLAAALLFAMPGTPFVYYGEELGMQGGVTPRDEDKRTPLRWTASAPGYGFTTAAASWYGATTERAGVDVETELGDASSLLSLYRRLIALRRGSDGLARGTAKVADVSGGRGTVALIRDHEGNRVLFVANLDAAASTSFAVSVAGTPRVLYQEGLVGEPSAEGQTTAIEGLMPRSFAFISLTD